MNLGDNRQFVTVTNPGLPVADGDGGFTLAYVSASPSQWWAAIQVASARLAERLFAATVIAHSTHILTGRFHPGIITKSRLTWTDRAGVVHQSHVLAVNDDQSVGVQTIALVSEIVP